MSTISTHVLDLVLGKPAIGVKVRLERLEGTNWVLIASSQTDGDGRCRDLAQGAAGGAYRLIFSTGDYLTALGRKGLFTEVPVHFHCDGDTNYHLPLLWSDNGYSTYRGS